MLPTLDHLVYAVPDLDAAVVRLEREWGVRPTAGGSHPGWGTRNRLLALDGHSYLEVIGPDPDQPDPVQPRPFGIDELTGPRLVTWALKADDLEVRVERAARAGLHLGPIRAMSRRRPDGTTLSWRLTVPETLPAGGLVPFLIDWQGTPSPALSAAQGCRLCEVRAEHPDPDLVARQLGAIGAALPVRTGPVPRFRAILETPAGRIVLQ